ncbi:MAG: hypothetical protein HQ503_16450 [Rhodospirillales bacterium]|nr:hypothetical protein [Rhodospirillales bacterium]
MAMEPNDGNSRLASQENLLLDYVHQLESHMEGRRAVHVHLSALDAHNRRDHHIRIAANTFEPLINLLEGQLFILKNSDLFFIYRGDSQNDVETSILKLRFLFSDDPLLESEAENDDHETNAFRSYYDVERDYGEILDLVRSMVHAEESGKAAATLPGAAMTSVFTVKQDHGTPLTPKALGQVEANLKRADLSNMVRRQFVCAIIGEAAPQALFSELYISIADLRETLMPGVNIFANKWLFQHLTETLDLRVLSMLSKSNDNTITGELSVNLNISTLLSPEFMKFDDSVIASMRGSIVIELQKVDIFNDLNAFLFARDFAKERGYRICIDGLTLETLPFVNRKRLGADLIKLVWQDDLEEKAGEKKIVRLVKRTGASKIILSRCDDERAVEFGHIIGINMFQGRHIESLLADETRRRDIEMARRRTQNFDLTE